MKLVELLVKELEEWPEGVTYFVQDCDREVKAGLGSKLSEPKDSGVWIRHICLDNYNLYSGLCTDWQTSIVTKDIYTKHKEETQMKQDLRNTKIHIKSEEHSKAFQEAVFAAGGEWRYGGEIYRGGVNFIFLNDSLGMTYCDNAVFFQEHDYKEIQFPLPTKGHVHAELMAQYAEDATTHSEPWKLWQIKGDDGVWFCCQLHPMWASDTGYRRKPKTHTVHGVEIPDLRVSLVSGNSFFLANPTAPELTSLYQFDGDIKDEIWVERGLAYQTSEEGKQAAIAHAKALLNITGE